MIPRALLGISGGGALGAVYAFVGRCASGSCALAWSPVPATLVGAGLGLFVVLTSRWD